MNLKSAAQSRGGHTAMEVPDSVKERRLSSRKSLNVPSSDSLAIPVIKEVKSEEEEHTTLSGSFTDCFHISSVPIPKQEPFEVTTSENSDLWALQISSNPRTPVTVMPIVQYAAQSPGGKKFVSLPGSNMAMRATGDMSTYQICSPTSSLPHGVVMASSPGSVPSPQQLAVEATRKRELRLMKNREAARECRRKKKEYVKCLENRVAVLENQNKTLIEELKVLKDLYCHKPE
ncbi:cAMP-responsive element modulator-like isoform X3 [Brienomyrus brachyistius]|uniref:cAMP-responsive element modulator-like isoform X3 n=1 Tax=Brienomyrus brachyistius TaxID=42636 RepID=UPI0020B3EB47|nr:cAMP-responsive element modulator-like isoform X3 [Brienomyrus brachyistius]